MFCFCLIYAIGGSIMPSREFRFVLFLQNGGYLLMNSEEDKIALDVLYYQEKIIETVTNCTDLRVLQYLEKFNRLWIEKHKKIKE